MVIGLIILFVMSGFIHSIAQETDTPLQKISRSKWLFVGGNGPGNYSKIQDALDNASDGDTVFVYDDSSPYHERIFLLNTINLIGENKDTTIIDGNNQYPLVCIAASQCLIRNFSIINSQAPAIRISSNKNKIENNIISMFEDYQYNDFVHGLDINGYKNSILNNTIIGVHFERTNGIRLSDSDDTLIYGNNISNFMQGILIENDCISTMIEKNHIYSAWTGIWDYQAQGTYIIDNTVEYISFEGIEVRWDTFGKISGNTVQFCRTGIRLFWPCTNFLVSENYIKNNDIGFYILDSYENTIIRNDFYDPVQFVYEGLVGSSHNKWMRNFWNGSLGIFPKIIRGESNYFPCINVDWFPAVFPHYRPFKNIL